MSSRDDQRSRLGKVLFRYFPLPELVSLIRASPPESLIGYRREYFLDELLVAMEFIKVFFKDFTQGQVGDSWIFEFLIAHPCRFESRHLFDEPNVQLLQTVEPHIRMTLSKAPNLTTIDRRRVSRMPRLA